jgi:glycosyltransferase involved in cell wall biosynthesis
VSLDVLLLRDMAEERRFSMERFADELDCALAREPRLAVKSTAIGPSPLRRVPLVGRADTYLARYVRYPLHARGQRASVYHLIDQGYGHVAALLPPHRTVVTCHDLMLLRAAEGGAGFKPRRRSVVRFRWSTGYLRKVGHVACVSEATRRDAIRLLGVEPSRTSVVSPGVDKRFRPLRGEDREVLARDVRGSSTHAILQVATGNPYKNIAGTLRVTRRLLDIGLDIALLRVGPPLNGDDLQLARELRLEGAIVEYGRVSDERLVELYNASDCLLFPSFWEGFGWPPLEAMACGTPVVVSRAPSLVEIVGDAGLTASATDIDGLTRAVASILSSPGQAMELARRGMKQASSFRWERAASAYAQIYEELDSASGAQCRHERRNGNSAQEHVPAASAQNGSPLRVLQVIAGLDPVAGGPPASAMATSLALRSRGVLNSFAYVDGPEGGSAANAASLSAAGIEIHRFPTGRASGSRGIRWGISVRLAVWLLRNSHRFDVLHMHGAWTFSTVAGLVAARLRRRVAVLSSHESLTDFDRKKSGPFQAGLKQLLRWIFVRSFNVVVVASTLEQRDMRDLEGLHSVVVPHAVVSVSGVTRNEANGNGLRVGFLGRLDPKKNLELLIDALGSLPGHVTLHVAGDGPPAYRASLVSRARSRGVDMRIRWLGFVGQQSKRAFLESIDVLAMPSAFEGFGMAAAEAIAARVPVIVSSRTGIAPLVERHGCGSVVEPDVRSLGGELKRVSFFREDARRATGHALGEISSEAHGARLSQLYEDLLIRKQRGRS